MKPWIVGVVVAISPTAALADEWAHLDPMPDADAQRLAIDGEDGSIYLFGGRAHQNAVHHYNIDDDTYDSLEDLPQGTAAPCGATLADGRIAVYGGFAGDSYVSDMQLYDVASDSWESGESISGAWACAAVATDDGRLHVFGGQNGQSRYVIYDPSDDSWETGPAIPDSLRRYGHGAALAPDGRFFLFGGRFSEDTIAIFDPGEGSWSEGPGMPSDRVFYGFATDGDAAYLMGGSTNAFNDQPPYDDEVWVYDFATSAWDTDHSILANALREGAGVIADGTLHLFGGSDGIIRADHQRFGDPVGGGESTGGSSGSSSGGDDTSGGLGSSGSTGDEPPGSTTDDTAGSTGTGATSTSAGEEGTGTSAGQGTSGVEPTTAGGAPGADDGCGCGAGRGGPWRVAALGLFLVAIGRRRARR